VSIPLREVSVLKVLVPLSFNVKLPLSAYHGAPIEAIEMLHRRLKECAVFPSGMYTLFLMLSVFRCLHM